MNQRSRTVKPGREAQNQLKEVKLNNHNLEISNTRYTENVFADVRQKLNRPEDDQIVLDKGSQCVDMGLFMSTTTQAAIHLEENYNENWFTCTNPNFEALKTLFDITQKLILKKHEIKHVSTIEWQFIHRMRSPLLHDKNNQVVRSKSTRLFRCSSLPGQGEVERTTPIFPEFPINRELVATDENHWSSSGVFSQDTPLWQDSYENDDSRNKT